MAEDRASANSAGTAGAECLIARRPVARGSVSARARARKLLFLPRVRLADGAVTGAAAFAATPHQALSAIALGQRPPRRALREEERDLRLLLHACQSAARWRGAYRLSFALGSVSAPDVDFVLRLREILVQSGLSPDRLDLEFQEEGFGQETDELIFTLAALRDVGVGTILTGFGRGASSLTLLRDRALAGLLSGIKLDRTLFYSAALSGPDVGHCPLDQLDQSFIRAAIGAGRNFDIAVHAEGVNHVTVADFLRDVGCDEAVGTCFSAPESAERMTARLERDRHPARH
ncbi:EAL domain-containing protein [Ameyamaea chiangmaiensis]|uniref:EAL domain-containing protein n=1 Tax=Ameyamaea chiangmaiensis TaxID=442969 RepID=A0A850PEK6_9PROT|nr:EAL domain-containing protein [Ameyamaea chiangmaiensis]MBS4075005.1 EAL domain-containing protein [Ameyamaea chiangmaiensis]NVN41293.1 EAL domain-containing protein [Ameyamaea chiangmaiensis]